MAEDPPVKRPKTTRRYLLVFSQVHQNFRIPEVAAVCDLLGVPFEADSLEPTSAHLHVLEFPDDAPVKKILSRSVLLKAAYEILEEATDLDELEVKLRANPQLFEPFNNEKASWRFRVRPQGKKMGSSVISALRERFTDAMMNLAAPVDLVNPVFEFNLIDDYGPPVSDRSRAFFCLTVGEGQGHLKTRFNLKERKYIGNSTMDPELALIQSNLIQARPNSLVLDPFAGTGGLLIPAAHFGAKVYGTEINYLVARGEGKSSRQGETFLAADQNVEANFIQYKLERNYGDVIVGDASLHGLWRQSFRFDAITSDPPYGVREKGLKVGFKERKEHWTMPSAPHEQHYPEKQKYGLNQTFIDLLNLAADRLVVGGRTAFWLPVPRDTYSDDVLPRHPAMTLLANCEQTLTHKSSRRLLVYQKQREPVEGDAAFVERDAFEQRTFREIVFVQGRRENETTTTETETAAPE